MCTTFSSFKIIAKCCHSSSPFFNFTKTQQLEKKGEKKLRKWKLVELHLFYFPLYSKWNKKFQFLCACLPDQPDLQKYYSYHLFTKETKKKNRNLCLASISDVDKVIFYRYIYRFGTMPDLSLILQTDITVLIQRRPRYLVFCSDNE